MVAKSNIFLMKKGKVTMSIISIFPNNMGFLTQNSEKMKDTPSN